MNSTGWPFLVILFIPAEPETNEVQFSLMISRYSFWKENNSNLIVDWSAGTIRSEYMQ